MQRYITNVFHIQSEDRIMRINYEYYKVFYYVAKYKNLTIAARELNNNQPNISRTIKILEQELGCKLILRKSRGIELTKEGEKLYFYVKNGINQLETGESEISSISSLQEGSITVGVSETAAYMILLPALKAFKAEYPNIKIKLYSHNTSTALDLVKQGLVDFSVTSLSGTVDDPLSVTNVLEYSDILIGGASYDSNKLWTLEEVSKLPLISLSQNSDTYAFYNSLFIDNSLPFTPMYEVETTSQLYPMITYDLGVAFIPPIYVQNALKENTVYELKLREKLPSRSICIVENKSRYANLAAEKLKGYCLMPKEYKAF